MQIVFATSNEHKLKEVRKLFADTLYNIIGLKDIGFDQEIIEDGETFEANARIKVNTVFDFCQLPCFADDSGIEATALDNKPGIYSARYAGPNSTSEENNNKLLGELIDKSDRSARFIAVVAYRDMNGSETFTGQIDGTVLNCPTEKGGFGYDPIFQPLGYTKSFAQFDPEDKNAISHRGQAIQKLINCLQKK